MRPYLGILILAATLGACAPAVSPTPTPTPTPEPVPEDVTRVPPPQPEELISEVPDRWWMLDLETNDIYGAGVDRAYSEALNAKRPQREVVVATLTMGIDRTNDDLDDVHWTNPDEPRNGRDDDGNGYVDDVHGWNFIGGPDGSHADEDTYEVARLVAACED